MKENILFVCALKEEVGSVLKDYNVLYTGVGKVNATFYLTKHLSKHPLPSLVINYGTAGSQKLAMGQLVDCTKFLQRDMDVSPLGFDKGVTPFDDTIPAILDFSHIPLNPIGKNYLCASGDTLVVGEQHYAGDLVDMEAYALAKVCYLFQIPFVSFKYISDSADANAPKDWSKNMAEGKSQFEEKILRKI
jgi:adenosylhomocysteine nucleosidase